MIVRYGRKLLICAALVAAFTCVSALAQSLVVPDDGLYTIGVTSSSRMFKIVKCVLRVRDGELAATLTLSGKGYGYLYPGTSGQADAVDRQTWVPFLEDQEGKYTYTIQIPSLDADLDVAAYSIKYSKWYDRILSFQSANLREYDAVPKDDEYAINVVSDNVLLSEAECQLTVKNGVMTAQLHVAGGVDQVYLGHAADATEAEESIIVSDGYCEFPVASMDRDFPISVHITDGDEWDSCKIMLDSTTLRKRVFTAADGIYSIDVETDSALLKVVNCMLKIKYGKMIALLTPNNANYDYLYIGLAKDARKDEAGWIPIIKNADGTCTYIVEIPAIDSDISVATYSSTNKRWYDRTLRFVSVSMAPQS